MRADSDEESKSTYQKWKEAQKKTYAGWIATAARFVFYGYLLAQPVVTAQALGLSSSGYWNWKVFLCLAVVHFVAGPAMSISSVMCYKYTGIVYGEDRTAFALAGGFDVGRWPILLVQAGVYGIYWWTLKIVPDPVAFARRPWAYLLFTTLIGWILTAIVAVFVFQRYAARRHEIVYSNRARRQG